jgi:hypothetical protein
MHHWGLGEGRHHGTQKTLRQPQKQGALKLGGEGKESRVLEQMKLPTLETLHNPALLEPTPQPIHPKTNPLNVFGTNGHDQGWGPCRGQKKQNRP